MPGEEHTAPTTHVDGLLSDAQDDINRALEAADEEDSHEVLKRSLCAVNHLSEVSEVLAEFNTGEYDDAK